MKCTLCGYEFDEKSAAAVCQGCFLAKGCRFVRCPNCFFELIPETSPDVPTKEREVCAIDQTRPLTLLEPLQKGSVCCIKTEDRLMLRKLIAIGILPETPIMLVQKFPSFVFEVNHDRFTVDRELASCIFVKMNT